MHRARTWTWRTPERKSDTERCTSENKLFQYTPALRTVAALRDSRVFEEAYGFWRM